MKKKIVAKSFKKSLRIALIYCLIGGLWILLSDKVLLLFTRDTNQYAWIQTIKGWVYVFITAAVILLLVFRELKKSDLLASENEVLLRELNHRIKNNLQMILSLLNLNNKKDDISEETRKQLANVQSQVQAISLVHQKLLGGPISPWVQFDNYIHELVEELRLIHCGFASNIEIKYSIKSVEIPLEKITSIGMIVSEIITNSFKHGFPVKSNGSITLTAGIENEGKTLLLSISDDGVGLDNTVKVDSGLGFTLVEALIQQLAGSIEINGNEGTTVRLHIPL